MSLVRVFLMKAERKIVDGAQACEHLFILYSLLSLSGYLLFFFINPLFSDTPPPVDHQLRLFTIFILMSFLAVSLGRRTLKISKIVYYLSWFVTVTVSKSFFFSFMLLQHNFNYLWSLNAFLATGFLLIIFDWVTAFILLFVGSLGGVVFFICTSGPLIYCDRIPMFLTSFISLLIYGALFSYRRQSQEEIRLARKNLNFQVSAIAHEMRTPLANVSIGGQTVAKSVKKMTEFLTPTLPPKERLLFEEECATLNKAALNLISVSRRSQNLINTLLVSLKQKFDRVSHAPLGMKSTLLTALEEFSYRPHEKEKVNLFLEEDFLFKGNQEIINHVIFNLLKNSFYFIHACGKGEIFITLKSKGRKGLLEFKDTGPGIKKSALSKIFMPFYSKRPHGTGVGLSFCKRAIESMKGGIYVDSVFGESTTFTIVLPKLTEPPCSPAPPQEI